MVGAVLVYQNTIIGEGYHQQYGQAHAEVNCINSVPVELSLQIKDSTLYVSLEPCAHFGKTPPCADLIIKKQIPRVVIGCRDSFAAVDGKGIDKLKAAGVAVTVGVLEKEALELNKRFFTFHQQQRPYIILKWAQSSDSKIAGPGGRRISISNTLTNRLVHQWRSEEAAIMVGTNTALNDNPALTTRLYTGKNPLRVVIDMELKLPGSLQLLDGTVKTIVFNAQQHNEKGNIIFYKLDATQKIIPQILQALYNMQVQSLIIEGGAQLLQSFINENLWDEARVITNTTLHIGDGINAPVLHQPPLICTENILTDKIQYFSNSNS